MFLSSHELLYFTDDCVQKCERPQTNTYKAIVHQAAWLKIDYTGRSKSETWKRDSTGCGRGPNGP